MLLGLPRGEVRRVLVGDPARVDRVEVIPSLRVVGRAGADDHVERGLRHVGVRVLVRLVLTENCPSIAETSTTCFAGSPLVALPGGAARARSMSPFSRAVMTNGAVALTSSTSRSSSVGTLSSVSRHELCVRRSTCWRSWSRTPRGKSSSAVLPGAGGGRCRPRLREERRAGHARRPAVSASAAAAPRTRARAHARLGYSPPVPARARGGGRRSRVAGHGLAGVVELEVEARGARRAAGTGAPRSARGAG